MLGPEMEEAGVLVVMMISQTVVTVIGIVIDMGRPRPSPRRTVAVKTRSRITAAATEAAAIEASLSIKR